MGKDYKQQRTENGDAMNSAINGFINGAADIHKRAASEKDFKTQIRVLFTQAYGQGATDAREEDQKRQDESRKAKGKAGSSHKASGHQTDPKEAETRPKEGQSHQGQAQSEGPEQESVVIDAATAQKRAKAAVI